MNFKITKTKRFISVLLSLSIAITMIPQTDYLVYAESTDNASDQSVAEPLIDLMSDLQRYSYGGHQYAVIETPMSWSAAKEYCENIGGHLATITDSGEQEFVETQLLSSDTTNRMYWLGGLLEQGEWKWITGEDFEYTNWHRNEPTSGGHQPYIQMYSPISSYTAGTWNNHTDNDLSSYWSSKYTGVICEWDTVNDIAEYAVFSGSTTQGLNLYGWKSSFSGDIYAGGGFNYGGSELYVNGKIDSASTIVTNGWMIEIDETNEYVDAIAMPDYDKAIHDNAEPYEYYEESPAYVQDRNVIDSSIKVAGDVVISGTAFEGDCYIIADGNITYNVESFTSKGRVFLYSINGNITINGSQIAVDGAMYAPNGSVTFNTYDTTVTGFICADVINFNGSIFNVISANYDMISTVTDSIIKTYTTSDDFAEGLSDGVGFAVPDQLVLDNGENTPVCVEKTYDDAELSSGVKIRYASDKSVLSDNDTVTLEYDLQGYGEANTKDSAVDLILVIDESFSMAGTRMRNTLAAARHIVSQMNGNDRCAIIGFKYDSVVRQTLTNDTQLLNDAISTVRVGSGTAIYTGLNSALEMFSSMSDPEREKYIILLSDGEDVAEAQLKSLAAAQEAGDKGIRIFAMMIGRGTLEMQKIAINSNGVYKNAPTANEIIDVMSYFAAEVFDVVGRNVTFKTTVVDKEAVDISAVSPAPSSVVYNEDNSVALEWYLDRISIDEIKSISIPLTARADNGYTELISDTSCVYYDRSGKSHVVYMDDVTLPVSNYVDTGRWSVVYDSGTADTEWEAIYWNGRRYGDGSINVSISVSEDGVAFSDADKVTNYESITGLSGRYIKLDVVMGLSSDGRSPELYDITVMSRGAELPDRINERPVAALRMKAAGKTNVPINLYVELIDDCLSSDVTVAWSCNNASVVFSDPSELFTTVEFSEIGEYTIVCTVNDGDDVFEATGTITVEDTDQYEDINPDDIESAITPEIFVSLPEYAEISQVITSKIEVLNNVDVSWYSVIVDDVTAYDVADDGSFSITMPGSEGICHIVVRAYDWAGNCDVGEYDIIVGSQNQDVVSPNVNIRFDKENYVEGESLTAVIEASDDIGVTNIELYVNGVNTVCGEDNSYEIESLEAGAYEFTAKAYDEAGNCGYSTYNIYAKDVTHPELSITVDNTTIELGSIVTGKVDVYDKNGLSSVELYVNDYAVDLDDASFCFVPETTGDYIITAVAVDTYGNKTTKSVTVVVVELDHESPSLSVSFDKEFYYIGDRAQINVTAHDNDRISEVVVTFNGSEIICVDDMYTTPILNEGVHIIDVIVYDVSGNWANARYQITVDTVLDVVAPVVVIEKIEPADIHVGDAVLIAVTASDENGIAAIAAMIDGVEVPVNDGVITYTAAAAGEHEVVVGAIDAFGNFGSASAIFEVSERLTQDTTAPNMSVSIYYIGDVPYVGQPVTFEVSAEDDSGIVYVAVTVDGEELAGNDSFEYVPVVAGAHEVVFTAWDAAGNKVVYEHTLVVYDVGDIPEDIYPPTGSVSFNKTSAVLGDEIIADITASDNSGEVFVEAVVNGVAVDVTDDRLRYTPAEVGVYEFVITFSDAAGNKYVCSQSIVVTSVDVTAPSLNVSGVPDAIVLGQSFVITIDVVDDSGNVNIFATGNDSEIDVADGTAIVTPSEAGDYYIKITASDGSGNERTFAKTVLVVEPNAGDVTAPELEIISFPSQVTVGEEVTIKFNASDDSGKVFEIVTVNGDEIECVDGIAVFVPHTAGNYNVIITVYDEAGNGRTASGTIVAVPAVDDVLPTMSITGLTHNMKLGDTAVIEITADDDSGSVSTSVTINGESVDIIDGRFEFTPVETGIYKLIIRTEDPSGNYVQKEFDVLVSDSPIYEDGKPVITISINNGTDTVNLGDTVDITVTAEDSDGIAFVTVDVNGEAIALDGNGNASFAPEETGRYTISVKAVDSLGNEISESVNIIVVDIDDNTVCDASITSPISGAAVTSPIDVLGTVSGDGLVYYSLEYCLAGSSEYIEFAYGEDVVSDGVLGVFDPTMLENGYYNIRLTAYSSNYNVSDEIVVSVEGQMKIGNYSIAFQDMDIPVTGYPLTVIRSYDSRRKHTSSDFGYGWDMTLSSIKLSESCAPGQYWSQEAVPSGYLTKYYFAEDRPHEISIDYGNGQVEKFTMKLSPDQQNLYPIELGISVSYEAQGNTKSKLEAIGTTTNLIYHGGVLCYSNTVTPYNPSQYKLTRADGTVYIISDKNGVEEITDPNGNVITLTENGVAHSDGKSIIFERDTDGRITRITDSYGKTVEYIYDTNGNLSAVKDKAGETTTFKYDRNHYLTDIIDARGVKIARNEYDDNGRLIATVDANGNRLEFSHDIEGRRDVVTDRLGNSTLYIYDDRGNVISETDALGNTTLSTYDSNGNLATKTDALGNVTTYNYNAQGDLLSMTDVLGNTVTNTYSEKGQLLSITSMGVTQFVVNYDDFGNLTSTADAMGNATSYEYDNNGRVTSITDEIGSYMKMYYDADGNVVSTVNGSGETATFTYDAEGNCASKTIMRGSEALTEQYAYDVYGNVTQIIYADGTVTSVEYDSVGNMTAAVDAKGRRTEYEYDLFGNLIKITYCDNTTETFEYDAEGRNISATDRMGRTVEMTYDAVGNLIRKSYPNGSEVSYTYDAKYRLISVTGANGGVTSYEYDVLDRNTAIVDALGNRTEFGYSTANGQLETMTDAKGNTYTYGYDLNGNRTSVTMPDGTSVHTAYDARGRVTTQTDQYGNVTRYGYDGSDRLTSVTDALGSTWIYEYNSVGELVTVTDANGNTTRYEYDNAGRVIKTINALGSTATVVYDEAGNVLRSTDYAGNVTTYVYDSLDRVIAKTVGEDTTQYSYTADGLLKSVTDKNGTTSYTYDIMSGLTSVTLYDGKTISYSYDEACRLTAVETPFGTTQYEYDLMDRVVRVVAHDGTATLYEYDENGNRTAVRYANGMTVSYEYDKVNRLVLEKVLDKNGSLVAKYKYTLGAAGERLKVEENDRTVEYEYDELFRLTKETVTDENGTSVTSYTYDKNSNRLTKTVDGEVTTYAYNELNQLISETGISYEYDLNGNLVKKTEGEQTTTYTYDARNKLIRVTIQSGQQVNVEEYLYDYAGNRIAKVQERKTTYYLVDTNGALSQVLAEYDDSSLITLYTRGEELISQERNGEKSYYLYDGFDSVRMLANEDNNITDTYTFDAFGNLVSSTGDTENSYLYRGEQYDSFTGLYYLRARYMNPSTGTFITMDEYAGSVFEPVSLHKYLYANANPVMYTDPTGYFSLSEVNVTQAIEAQLHKMLVPNFSNIVKWTNFFASYFETCYNIGQVLYNGGSLADIAASMVVGLVSGFMLNQMCLIKCLGPIIAPLLVVTGFAIQYQALNDAIEEGDWASVVLISIQMVTSVMSLGSSCFTGETLVAAENGLKRIDEIKVGDKVWAYNVETGETELKTVTKVYVHAVDEILHLSTTEGNIDTTTNHPFYVLGKGWVAAGDLVSGDEVYNLDGTTAVVISSWIEKLDTPVLVYNLEVEDFHSYFVGDASVLVHNYHSKEDTLNNWLKDDQDLLDETRQMYNNNPEWWGIDPDNTPVFYRDNEEVNAIRRKPGESGGHHPHGLALGGPEGQNLTPTNETRSYKNPTHSYVTGLQRRVINVIKQMLGL